MTDIRNKAVTVTLDGGKTDAVSKGTRKAFEATFINIPSFKNFDDYFNISGFKILPDGEVSGNLYLGDYNRDYGYTDGTNVYKETYHALSNEEIENISGKKISLVYDMITMFLKTALS